jgi:allophanate hydrolase subunit 1
MLELQLLGDQGALARFADEAAALRWAQTVRGRGLPWAADVVQAYTTVAVFLTPDGLDATEALRLLQTVAPETDESTRRSTSSCAASGCEVFWAAPTW